MITVMLGMGIRSKAAFKTIDAVLVDPTAVLLKLKNPSTSLETTLTYGVDAGVTKDSTGLYHYDFKPTIKGDWIFRWVGTGNINVAQESIVRVLPSQFTTP